jgi:hypothetical protein
MGNRSCRLAGEKFVSVESVKDSEKSCGVACLMLSKQLESELCGLCGMSVQSMSEDHIENSRHFCYKCHTVLCDGCGHLLNTVKRKVGIQSRMICGEMLVELSRKHRGCPNCDVQLRTFMGNDFADKISSLVQQFSLTMVDDGSFVVVETNSLTDEARSKVIAQLSRPKQLLDFAAKDSFIGTLLSKLESSPDDLTWFHLAENMPPTGTITFRTAEISKEDCYIQAIQLSPATVEYYVALLFSMTTNATALVNGKLLTRSQIAAIIIQLRPNSSEAWRNLGLVLSSKGGSIHIGDEEFDRTKALQKSIDLAPTNSAGLYACAVNSYSNSQEFLFGGARLTRLQILHKMLDDGEEQESLEDLVNRWLGPKVMVFVTSELSLLFPEHPRVMRMASEFVIDKTKVLGVGAFGSVYCASRTRDGKQQLLAAKQVSLVLDEDASLKATPELCLTTNFLFQEVMTRAFYVQANRKEMQTTIFMEYAQHGSCHAYMKNVLCGRMHEMEVRQVFEECLNALALLHKWGVIHQDIKPANILVFADSHVKLSDFGISALTHCDLVEKEAGGTELYMAPEVYNDGVISEFGDIWSLAVTIVELGSGVPPAPDPDHVKDAQARHPFRPFIPQHFSSELRVILNSCFNYDNKARPSATRLLKDKYFKSSELPLDSEPVRVYQETKTLSGVPDSVLAYEEVSAMGFDTRRLESMTRGNRFTVRLRNQGENRAPST